MSVRAHRILKVEYADNPSFNLYHDEKLVQFLDRQNHSGFYSQLSDDGGGVVSVEVSVLRQAIEKASELELDKDDVKTLQADIEASGEGETIDYDCF